MKRNISHFTLIMFFVFFNVHGCDFSKSDNKDEERDLTGPFTYTITDTSTSYPSGKYLVSAFTDNNTYVSGISAGVSTALTNGNSLSISGIEAGTNYDIYIWIDADGDGDYGDDSMGKYIRINNMQADFAFSGDGTLFTAFVNKDVSVNSYTNLTGTAFVVWLPGGAEDVIDRNSLYSAAGRESLQQRIGSVSCTLSNSTTCSTGTAYDFPLPSRPYGFGGSALLAYTVCAVIDLDGSDSRTNGDYEGCKGGEDATGDPSSVSLGQLTGL